jgi:hypothetical protein
MLKRSGLTFDRVRDEVSAIGGKSDDKYGEDIAYASSTFDLLYSASDIAFEENSATVTPEHILAAINLLEEGAVVTVLEKFAKLE